MEIKFKTSKSNAYVIENGLKKIEKIEKFNFDKTLILANSTVTDPDIVVITHGFSDEKYYFKRLISFKKCHMMKLEKK